MNLNAYERDIQVEVIRDTANSVCAHYCKFFIKAEIDETQEKEHPLVKMYWEVCELEKRHVYDCKTKEEFDKLFAKLNEAENLLNEYRNNR